MRRVLSVAIGLLLLLPLSTRAAVEDVNKRIGEIKTLVVEANYEKALLRVEAVQNAPLTSEQEVTLWMYEGILSSELGDDTRAESAFQRALTRQCDAQPPVKVSPKVTLRLERLQKTIPTCARPPPAPSSLPSPEPSGGRESLMRSTSPAPAPSPLRKVALIAGGAVALVGGGFYVGSRVELNRLRDDASQIASREEAHAIARRGQTFQVLGVSLLGLGAAGLATSAAMSLWGTPSKSSASLRIGTDGTSAFVYGRWP